MRVLLLVVSIACVGCWSRDNPADPGRCEPRCQAPALCWEGRCQLPDRGITEGGITEGGPGAEGGPSTEGGPREGGVTDQGTDRQLNPEPPIKSSQRPASELAAGGNSGWADIAGLAPITVSSLGEDYLILFNIPDVRTQPANVFACFGIFVDGAEVAGSCFNTARADRRLPVTVVAVAKLGLGPHTIKGRWWLPTTGQKLVLGMTYATWLATVRADAGIVAEKRSGGELAFASDSWTDVADLKPITVSGGADYLLILSVPETWRTSVGLAQFQILVDGKPANTAYYTAAFANQRVPVALVAVADDLPAGSHTIKAQAAGNGLRLGGGTHVPWLVALRWHKPIAYGLRPTASEGKITSSQKYVDVGIPAVPVPSSGGDHLLLFNAPDTWVEPDDSWAAFHLKLDNVLVAGGNYQAGCSGQRVPSTVLGVRALGAGNHTLTTEWVTTGTAHQGVTGASVLLSLSP